MKDTSGNRNTAWSSPDGWILAGNLLISVVLLFRWVNWRSLPAEDALMLMRYATHVAQGHGIVWNIGDRPVEGATDFLYLIVLSAWMKASHLGAIWAARTLLAVSHLLGVALLYWSARRIAGVGRFVASILTIYFGIGPGIIHTANGFSSPFYGLMSLAAWSFACLSVLSGTSGPRNVGFATFALLAGLTRPDGVLLAIFMTIALVYGLRGKSIKIVATTAAAFVVLGGAYFVWRFHYFGYLLPNPFYKKGGGHLYLGSLKVSVGNVIKLLLPAIPIFLLGLALPRTRRLSVFSLIPVAGFTVIWILLTNENNAAMRFQYIVLPVGLLSAAVVLKAIIDCAQQAGWIVSPDADSFLCVSPTARVACTVAVSLLFYLWWNTLLTGPEVVGTGPFNIAVGLSKYENRHYTMVATEAGVIPYFSHWRTIDGWGLNDPEIVHNPHALTTAYLDKNHPAIIMMDVSADTSGDLIRVWNGDTPPSETINFVMDQASHYALTHGYLVAARWGITPCEVNIWYLRKDLPEFQDMLRIIRREPYFDPYNESRLATNFLEPEPPAQCTDNKYVVNPKD